MKKIIKKLRLWLAVLISPKIKRPKIKKLIKAKLLKNIPLGAVTIQVHPCVDSDIVSLYYPKRGIPIKEFTYRVSEYDLAMIDFLYLKEKCKKKYIRRNRT